MDDRFVAYARQWGREREERAKRAGTWPRPAPEDQPPTATDPETPSVAERAARWLAHEMKRKRNE